MEFNNDLAELAYFFDYDNEVLELVNSDVSISVKGDLGDLDNNLEEIFDPEEITFLDTSKVYSLYYTFYNNKTFNLPLLWNTKKVGSMYKVFRGATSFNQPLFWKTDRVRYMSEMFYGATSFNQKLDWNVEKWAKKLSSFQNPEDMFKGATSFNQVLDWGDEWDDYAPIIIKKKEKKYHRKREVLPLVCRYCQKKYKSRVWKEKHEVECEIIEQQFRALLR